MRALLSDVMTILYRELLRYRRERLYLIGQILIPVGVVVFIGLPADRVGGDSDYVSFLASGLMMLTISSGAIGGGYTLMEDIQRGFLRPILVAPVSRISIVVGKVLARLLLSMILALSLLGVFALFTNLRLAHPFLALGALAAVTFGFVALGILLATSMRRTESFRFAAVFITAPLYLLSGMFFPLEALPTPMRLLAHLNPLTYGVDLLRYSMIGIRELPLLLDQGVLLLFAVTMTWLAARGFERRLAS